MLEALICPRREDGLSCQHGFKPLTHSLTPRHVKPPPPRTHSLNKKLESDITDGAAVSLSHCLRQRRSHICGRTPRRDDTANSTSRMHNLKQVSAAEVQGSAGDGRSLPVLGTAFSPMARMWGCGLQNSSR